MNRHLFLLCTLAASLGVTAPSQAAEPTSRLDKIMTSKEVRVCMWPDYYGISYRNPKTQQLSGIDTDLAQAFAKDLKVSVRFVESSFAKLVDDVGQDRCDVAMFAVGITPARAEKLRFTRPYLTSDIYAITTKSNRRIKTWADIDQAGVVVAVAKGTYHEPVMREKLKAASLLVVDSPHAREQEVESGRADVFMTNFPYTRRMLDNVDWARRIAPPSTYHLMRYAYAVRPGDDRWLARVERFVSDIKRDGRLMEAARRNGLEPIVILE